MHIPLKTKMGSGDLGRCFHSLHEPKLVICLGLRGAFWIKVLDRTTTDQDIQLWLPIAVRHNLGNLLLFGPSIAC